MTAQQIKPVYFDLHNRKIASLELHVNNGNDVSLIVVGHFALNSMESAKLFFASLDFEAAGLSSTALLYKGDEKNSDQYAGEVFFNKQYGYYGIGLKAIDKVKFLQTEIPLFGFDGNLVCAA